MPREIQYFEGVLLNHLFALKKPRPIACLVGFDVKGVAFGQHFPRIRQHGGLRKPRNGGNEWWHDMASCSTAHEIQVDVTKKYKARLLSRSFHSDFYDI